jgi:Flp pilus assembly protein TadD
VAAIAVSAVLVVACAAKSLDRLPAWRDNRGHLLTLLDEHPESSRAHASAAAVLGGIKDTAGARREYRTADSLFSGDPFVTAAQAILLLSLGDTGAAGPLVARLRGPMGPSAQLVSLRVRFLASLSRADTARARALAAEAAGRAPWEESWYRQYLQ